MEGAGHVDKGDAGVGAKFGSQVLAYKCAKDGQCLALADILTWK